MENKVFVVVGSVKFEGESLHETGKAFYAFNKAQKYGAWLVGQGYCSYSIKEVEME